MLQLILISSFVIVAAYFVSSYISKAGKQSKLRRQNSKYQILVDNLQMQLNDSKICTNALQGKTMSLVSGQWTSVSLNLSFAKSPGPIEAGWEDKEADYHLKDLELMTVHRAQTTDASGNPIIRDIVYDWPNLGPTANSFRKYYSRLRIVPNDSHWDVKNEETWVKLAVIVTPAGLIHQCFGEFSAAEACELAGGAWDSSNNSSADHRCNPDLQCFNHSMGLVSDSSSCAAPYLPNPMGYINGTYKYLCTWCNRNH